jgi:hypothetical protein
VVLFSKEKILRRVRNTTKIVKHHDVWISRAGKYKVR